MTDAEFFTAALALFGTGLLIGFMWGLRARGRENCNGVADLTPYVPKSIGPSVGPSPVFWPYLGHCANGCGLLVTDGGFYCKRCREAYHLDEGEGQ